jgi:hypothetical protein
LAIFFQSDQFLFFFSGTLLGLLSSSGSWGFGCFGAFSGRNGVILNSLLISDCFGNGFRRFVADGAPVVGTGTFFLLLIDATSTRFAFVGTLFILDETFILD